MVVLAIHFSPFDVPRFDRNGPPVEVGVVKGKTAWKPTKADILAQAGLDGGGNTDANRRAKTPFPVPVKDSEAQDLETATQRVRRLEARTQEMLTQLKSAATVAPATAQPNDAPEVPALPNANEMMQRTLETMRLEAQIAKQMEVYQKRPKRRFVGARAEEYRFARYVEDWRIKVEGIGNPHYPAPPPAQALTYERLLAPRDRFVGTV